MSIKSTRVLISIFLLFSIKILHANINEEITILPTINAPHLLQVNKQEIAQFAVKNLSQKTIILAMMPQEGVTQDTTGLLACSSPFQLKPGQKCLLNLKIKGLRLGEKIVNGPLICQATPKGQIKPDPSFCAQPTVRDSLNITFVKAQKAIIEVKPQVLVIHAKSISPVKLTVINHSETVTALNISADLPHNWKDVLDGSGNLEQKSGKIRAIPVS